MPRAVPLLIASALIASVALPASAQMTGLRQSERVHYGDLDLYNTKDAEELLDRIDSTAYRLCGGQEAVGGAERRSEECADDSTDLAVRRLDHPVVTALNEGLSPEVVVAEGDAYYPDDGVKK